jgi:hypothetical protein
MENSEVKTGAETGEAAPSMELAERLLQRRTEPVGVIDVRQGQRHYARTAGWVAQRFAMLDHWKTRYGVDEGAAANDSLIFTSPPRTGAEVAPTASNSIQLARAVKESGAFQPSVTPAVSAAPPGQYRIRRRSMASASLPQDTASPEPRLVSATQTEGDKSPPGASESGPTPGVSDTPGGVARVETERGVIRAAEFPTTMPLAAPNMILSRKAVEAAPETPGGSVAAVEHQIQRKATLSPPAITTTGDLARKTEVSRPHSVTPSATAAAPVQAPARSSGIDATPAELPLRLRRKPAEAAKEPLAVPATQTIAQTPLSNSSMQPLVQPLLESQSFSGGGASGSVTEQTRPAGIGDTHTTGASATSLPLIQRQPVGGAPQPVMIWRRSVERSSLSAGTPGVAPAVARSAFPLAIGASRGSAQKVARQAATDEATSPTSAESAQPAQAAKAAPAAAPNEINVARLAEQVSRLLARQLAVERERRGRGGWR